MTAQKVVGYIVARPSDYRGNALVTWGTGVSVTLDAAEARLSSARGDQPGGYDWRIYEVREVQP